VKERARTLVDPPAPDDLWAGIASRLGPAGSTSSAEDHVPELLVLPRRHLAWTMPRALAAGIALLLVSAGALWLAQHRGPLAPGSRTLASSAPVRETAQPASFNATQVEGEIAELQRALDTFPIRIAHDHARVKIVDQILRSPVVVSMRVRDDHILDLSLIEAETLQAWNDRVLGVVRVIQRID
jgi:hypothetical protein